MNNKKRNLLKFVVTSLIVFCFSVSINSQTNDKQSAFPVIEFEGILLAKSNFSLPCGIIFNHEVALYRVSNVLKGEYYFFDMVVDHPDCEFILRRIKVGDKVKLSVTQRPKYSNLTFYPGIREEAGEVPKTFYVASTKPQLIQ